MPEVKLLKRPGSRCKEFLKRQTIHQPDGTGFKIEKTFSPGVTASEPTEDNSFWLKHRVGMLRALEELDPFL